MASVTFYPGRLRGAALVPPAKSEAHRALLLAAFSGRPCRLEGFAPPLCDDTHAMINGITALGASVRAEGTALIVTPMPQKAASRPMVDCQVHACAAALRMLIPAFLVRGQAVRFHMEPGLFRRPLDAFEPLIRKLGATLKRVPPDSHGEALVELSGHMPAGHYTVDGSRSSQFASGQLIALSHAADAQGQPAPSRLQVAGPIVSRPYLDMTLALMRRFGLSAKEEAEGLFVLSPAAGSAPASVSIAGDWSQAAVLLCMNAMGSDIAVQNLYTGADGLQGDARVVDALRAMKGENGLAATELDCSDIPDLAPILALTCSQARGVSTLRGVNRLRIKESDRLAATCELLAQLGVHTQVSEDGDTLFVHGPARLTGGFEADARGDHRLVMLLAAAALIATGPITVHGAQCIAKSWPGFVETYRQLGGRAE